MKLVNILVVTAKPQGFSRRLRLLKPGEFQRVFHDTHCKSVDDKLTILARRNDLEHARLGLAISKRAVRAAVGRNRIKRLVRESFRLHQEALQDLDIVVLARRAAAGADNEALRKSLNDHWRRLAKRCVNS